jgi:hypothetical protein
MSDGTCVVIIICSCIFCWTTYCLVDRWLDHREIMKGVRIPWQSTVTEDEPDDN